jgi:hypothetical protein
MPFEIKDVQATPNPNAAKFALDRPIVEQTASFFNAQSGCGLRAAGDGRQDAMGAKSSSGRSPIGFS